MIFAKTAVAAGAVAAGVYCFFQNKQLIVTEYELSFENLPKAFSGKRILQLSDLHTKTYGENYDELINLCKSTKPDYIFFTGDLFSRKETVLENKAVLMKRLREIAPVYYIFGNHEIDIMEKTESFVNEIKPYGIHVLRNQKTRVYIGEEYINIYGADFDRRFYVNAEGNYSNLPDITADVVEQLLGKPDEREFNLLLSHNPFPFESYVKWGADLIFSGHCHGGVVRLPMIGGLLSPERKFFPRYSKGVYKAVENGRQSQMVVSAGLGKFRLNNPSEIVAVTLKNS